MQLERLHDGQLLFKRVPVPDQAPRVLGGHDQRLVANRVLVDETLLPSDSVVQGSRDTHSCVDAHRSLVG